MLMVFSPHAPRGRQHGRGQVFSPAQTGAFLALPLAVAVGAVVLLRRLN
jgi:hypothetical protein